MTKRVAQSPAVPPRNVTPEQVKQAAIDIVEARQRKKMDTLLADLLDGPWAFTVGKDDEVD